jgi:hypothetical protein
MIFLSYFKKTLLVLLSLGLISTANSMDAEEEYFIATSAHNKAFEETKRVTGDSRDAIELIVDSKSQHAIFMIKTQPDKFLNKILEIFENFATISKDNSKKIFKNILYSGGITGDDKDHDSLVVAPGLKFCYDVPIKNVYAPSHGDGYNIGPNQARVSYKIDDPAQLLEFWHTEPLAMEQFLRWKYKEMQPIKNIIIVSRLPMCQFCSAFLLHCFYTEAAKRSDVNFIVVSLPALENITKSASTEFSEKLRGLLEVITGYDIIKRGKSSKRVGVTLFSGIKADSKGVVGNNLSIYGF